MKVEKSGGIAKVSGFYGQFPTTLDEKGRFALPAKLRNVVGPSGKPILEGTIVLTKGLEGCLSLYPEAEWEEIQKRLSSQNFTHADFRYFSRRFYSMAAAVSPDRSGRVLIPANLLAEAQLKKDLLLIGVNRMIEIWNPANYDKYVDDYPGSFEDVAERLYSGPGGDGQQ